MGTAFSEHPKTIVIGLGNPILSDDSVGIKIARSLKERLYGPAGVNSPEMQVDIIEIYAGGMRLMDTMVGYERAIIVDAIVSGGIPGSVRSISLQDVCTTRNIICTHDTGLSTALEMGRMLGLDLPSNIRIWAIEAKDVVTFSEELTSEVSHAVPLAVGQIYAFLFSGQEFASCAAGQVHG